MEANVLTTGLLAKTKPEVIDSLNNGQGTFLYNHNIKEVKVIADKEGGIEITTDAERATGTMFQYDSVRWNIQKRLIIFSARCLLQDTRLRQKVSW